VLIHLQQLGVVEEIANLPTLRRDLSRLITKYYFLPRKELRLGELLQRINNLLFEHNIRMAYEFGLMAKALFLTEGIAQALDPDFDYNEAARPVINEIRMRYYAPRTFIEDSLRELRGLRRQIVDLPRRVNTILTHFERGTFKIDLVDDIWDIKEGAENILVNRISFAILIIGVLVASSIILSGSPTGWLRYVGIFGLAVDGVFMVILLFSLLRSGRI
jgi:ubiquinone biosynthesis protein